MASADRTIVINADDLGVSEDVNDAIFDAHDRGVVTSATLLVGAPAVEHALIGARLRPQLGVGVHLDTSEFEPLTREFLEIRALRPSMDVRRTQWVTPSLVRALTQEWCAQVAAARSLGVAPTHADSHHFDHVNPLLLPTLVKALRRSGIRRVRGMHNLWVDPPRAAKVKLKSGHRWAIRRAGLVTTDYMCDVGSYLALASAHRVPPSGSFELMAHPGHPNYETETAKLVASAQLFEQHEMISWEDVR